MRSAGRSRPRGLAYEVVDGIEERVAALLAERQTVAWFQGRMGLGPRALGSRSLLADPRDPETATRLNRLVKHREPFRPFCPSVLEEHLPAWFRCPSPVPAPCRYMLAALDVDPDLRDRVPAVVHVDGTARVQSVSARSNPRFHRLIEAFHDLTGVPMVLNTSFNDREPIVCSPADAITTVLAAPIDVLAIGDFLVRQADNLLEREAPDVSPLTYFEKLR